MTPPSHVARMEEARPLHSSMPMKLVSVIMPAYNVAPFLEAAALSVIRQTYPAIELIIVDDGSKDDTYGIACRLQAQWPDRIRVIQHENRGLAEARNSAIREARGEYLALLDSDDVWDPDYLRSQVAILDREPSIDIVTGNARYLGGYRHGRLVRPHPDNRPQPNLRTILTDEEAVFIMSVFRRRVAETIDGFTPVFRTNEDFDFWLRAARAGFTFYRNSTPLGWYRVRGDSLSANQVRMLSGALRVLERFAPAVASDPEHAQALQWQARRFKTQLDVARVRARRVEPAELSVTEFLATLPTLGGIRHAIVAALARIAPKTFGRVYALTRSFAATPLQAAPVHTPPARIDRADRAGKEYWDNVWTHLAFSPDISPHDENIWAYRDHQFHRFFCSQLRNAPPGFSVLELGCAGSAWLPYFAREFDCRVAGLDYSTLGARQAADRLAASGIAADIRCADLFEPPPDWIAAFDVVVWFGVAEHFEDTGRAIRAAAAYLKPGGLLVTEIPNLAGFNGMLQRLVNRPIYDIHVPLDARELAAHHEAAGLNVERSEYLVPTDFGILNLENHPPGPAYKTKDRALFVLRLLSGGIWWLDRKVGPFKPGRLTSGFVIVAARRPGSAAVNASAA
jgi:GT2 family glycosyltransferase/SAM-dependent methyltransferase